MTPVLLPVPRRVELGDERGPGAVIGETRSASLPSQGYRLDCGADGVRIEAADDAGAFYARTTLAQLADAAGTVPLGTVEDWPDIAVRGVMLDVSRDKVPTMATLLALVERLASWKINHLQLYIEHTFAYAGHDEVWAAASPFTPDELRELDRACRALHIELAANQNCLGHMERWLAHERYRPLAIRPDGWTDARGRHRRPTTLEPTNPASLPLVRDLLAQLTPCFTSRRINVGLDEPWELPDERYDDYLRYAHDLRAVPELDGMEMLMWGDIVAGHPERMTDVPDGTTICEWGYEANHPFTERTSALAAAGKPFWVCPGTSSWNTIVGRTTNMRENTIAAASAGVADGAAGYLTTDWGDNGHLQYLPFSEPGLAHAAAVSWCLASNRDLDLAAALDAHVFADASGLLGQALMDLGDAHRAVEPQVGNMSVFFLPLFSSTIRQGEGVTAGMTDADLERAAAIVDTAAQAAARSTSARADAAFMRDEVAAGAELTQLLIRDARARLAAGGRLDDVDAAERDALAATLAGLIDRHRALWRARNREGGLVDSVAVLARLEAAYRA